MRRVPHWSRIGAALRLGALALVVATTLAACRLTTKTPPLLAQAAGPAFAIDSTLGPLSSQEALSRGPLVLIFYRGHW